MSADETVNFLALAVALKCCQHLNNFNGFSFINVHLNASLSDSFVLGNCCNAYSKEKIMYVLDSIREAEI